MSKKISTTERALQEGIKDAFKDKDQCAYIKTGDRLMKEYKGDYHKFEAKGDRFIVNTIWSLANLIVPNLIFNDPYIKVKATKPYLMKKEGKGVERRHDNTRAATIREASLNHDLKLIKAKDEWSKAIFDSLFYSVGIIKTGYSYDSIVKEDGGMDIKDSFYIKRISPKDFGWHPFAVDVHDSPYLIHRVVMPRHVAAANPKLKGKIDDVEDSVPEYYKDRARNSTNSTKNDGKTSRGYITLYEVENKEDQKIYVFGGEYGETLLYKDDFPYDFMGTQYNVVRFSGDTESFEGVSMLGAVEDLALMLNEMMTKMIIHIRKFPGTIFLESQGGPNEEEALEQLRNGSMGGIMTMSNVDGVKFQQPMNMGIDYYQIYNLITGTIDKLMSVQDFRVSGGGGRKSATEAAMIRGDKTIRRAHMLQQVKNMVLDSATKLSALQAQFKTEEEEIEAIGEMTGRSFKYSKEDMKGDFSFDFDVEEMRAFNEAEAQSMNSLLQVLGSHEILHPILRKLDPQKVGKTLFKAAGVSYEGLTSEGLAMQTFILPDKENEMARDNEPMPNPKKGEDHDYHLEVHALDLKKKGNNKQIMEHMAMTLMLKDQEKQEKSGIPQPQQPNRPMPGGVAGAPAGPAGPAQEPPATPNIPGLGAISKLLGK